MTWLHLLLLAAAGMQLGIALLNLTLVRIMRWQSELERMDLIVREVFKVHSLFISITVAMFGILTWRFVETMVAGGNEACAWLAGGIGIFWSIRAIIQWIGYSESHWRGKLAPTVVHWVLFLVYSAFGALYLRVSLG